MTRITSVKLFQGLIPTSVLRPVSIKQKIHSQYGKKLFSNSSSSRLTGHRPPVIHSPLNIKTCSILPDRVYPRYGSVNNSKLKTLIWPPESLRNVFLMKKPHNDEVTLAMIKVIRHLSKEYPNVNIIVTSEVASELLDHKKLHGLTNYTIEKPSESTDNQQELAQFAAWAQKVTVSTASESPEDTPLQPEDIHAASRKLKELTLHTGSFLEIIRKADLLVTLGGDGTILKSASLFADHLVPPVLSFSLGTLGFLLPYDFSSFKDAFKKVYTSNAKVLQRSRLECHIIKKNMFVEKAPNETQESGPSEIQTTVKTEELRSRVHAMNDIILHRGSVPHLATLDVYIDGEFLTRATGDGLIISSPTGSTAYSLSAGGSIVHPLVKCILLTPICPRSLSFRPLVVPSTSHIKIKIQRRNSKTQPPNRCAFDDVYPDPDFDDPVNSEPFQDDVLELLSNQATSSKLSIDGASHVTKLSIGDEIHIFNEIGTIFIPGSNLPDYIIKSASPITVQDDQSRAGPDGLVKSRNTPSGQFLYKLRNSSNGKAINYGGITSGTIIENEHKGVYCVAKGENDWTKGINESLGFNSRFKESRKRKRVVFDEDEEDL